MALVFASLHLVSRTRFDPALRLTGAGVALAAAAGWAFDRLGALANPLAGAEDAVITHPWWVVAGLAVVAAGYALYRLVLVVVETRLQEAITGPARATVTSVAGVGLELSALLVFAAYAVGGLVLLSGAVLVLAAALPRLGRA